MRAICSGVSHRLAMITAEPLSLNRRVNDEDDASELGTLIPADGPSPFDLARRAETRLIVERAFRQAGLDSREELIIRMRFGIGTLEEHTLEEIGVVLNLSRERIRQIEADALVKLGTELAYRFGYPEPDKYAERAIRRRTLDNSRKAYVRKLKLRLGEEGYRAMMREQWNARAAKKRAAV